MLLIFIFKNSCLLFIDLCFFINFIFNFFLKRIDIFLLNFELLK